MASWPQCGKPQSDFLPKGRLRAPLRQFSSYRRVMSARALHEVEPYTPPTWAKPLEPKVAHRYKIGRRKATLLLRNRSISVFIIWQWWDLFNCQVSPKSLCCNHPMKDSATVAKHMSKTHCCQFPQMWPFSAELSKDFGLQNLRGSYNMD
jgi:hypothetical protein